MTQDTQHTDESGEKNRCAKLMLAVETLVLLGLSSLGVGSGTGRVVAQTNNSSNISEKAPYYANKSTSVGMDSWLAGTQNASLTDMVDLFMRLPGVVVGTGPVAVGGIGYAGGLIMAILVLGMSGGVVAGTGMGMVAATILLIMVLAGMVTVGLAPSWLWLVVLIGIGLLGYRALHSILS